MIRLLRDPGGHFIILRELNGEFYDQETDHSRSPADIQLGGLRRVNEHRREARSFMLSGSRVLRHGAALLRLTV